MTKLFALLAVLLILSGTLILAVPKLERTGQPGLAPQAIPVPTMVDQARDLAEQVNAPLSIVFGLISLYYSRRSYVVNRDRALRDRGNADA